ncbi:helicase-exonuclease AddAB subunit AddB [Gracilibacillus caseinilyticus]|uniref:ATP-dependent helicase/deoxyribonuclease subunit B n=1 Tax=Gracilibacillus caseinilyticus TaxID=2932256 RepID=A0ABY4F2W8_9BACI|nr:helicase-exonuclease AddAB subunit AddB [Gracilibacillus caseinilyticus]UOQ50585.1 helicase-exonuclease AddAB subunit AddB [Gracilibacillus caseinilyticus]
MLLRFLMGSATVNKSEQCLQEIRQELRQDPQGPSIIYLVPDQMTFQQEYALLNGDDINGSIRAQVYSFSRLAWRVMQLTGGATKKYITSTGMQMMLRKIVEERTDDWKVFQKAIEKQGFIEQLEEMITEFKRYCVTPDLITAQLDEMDRFQHKTVGEVALHHKLDDLLYIYQSLQHALAGHYMDSEDQLQQLVEKLEDTNFLENTTVYIDGFHQFTPQELLVIEVMIKKAKNVTVTLTLEELNNEVTPLDLFYQTKETYYQLQQLAEQASVPVEIEYADQNAETKDAFIHLDHHFDSRPVQPFSGEAPIRIAEAVHPRAEVEGTAQEIVRLVRDQGYRYRDLAILIREPDVYHDLITTVFQDYQIPIFVDEKRTMLNHPLIETVRSLLDVVEGNWRYDAVFRLLKAGFIPQGEGEFRLDQEAIDELENYVLEYGVRGRSRWLSDKDWIFQRFRGFDQSTQTDRELVAQKRINHYRDKIAESLTNIDTKLRTLPTIRQKTIALFEWLESIGAPAQLEQMREDFDAQGRVEKGREQDQVWDAVIQLLEEITEVAGEEEMSLSTFRNVLESGFDALRFSHVPPSIDHVVVGSIDRSRMHGIKTAFLLGVNEGTWPMKPGSDGLITEEERSVLQTHGLKLAEGSKRQLLDDWFYVYLAFSLPADYLWISYPISNEEGNQKAASSLIKRMEELFPHQQSRLFLQDPEEMTEANRFVTTPNKTRGALTAQLARKLRGYPIESIWESVLNWFIEHSVKQQIHQQVLKSLFYQNKPVDLEKDTVQALYEKEINASVSRLEMYHRCSYQHFARYSLGLEDRPTYKLDAPDIGQLFHEALKQITEWIQKEGRQFADVYDQDARKYANRAVGELANVLQHQILHSSNRYQYIQKKLESVIARATFILSEQARKTHFAPVGLEVGFGYPDQLQSLTVPLPNDHTLLLRGRIDRVDQAFENEQLYLRIIDYKSSAKGLNLTEVYYGLALQMLAYLDVVLQNAEGWLGHPASPAGVLYFHVHNPMISADDFLSEDKLEQEIFKKFKMKGLMVDQEEVVRMMDTTLDYGRSNIIPAGFSKTGSFYKGSQVAEQNVFNELQGYIHRLMENAGLAITEGKVDLNPFQQQQLTACTFCDFRSVCQFDPTLAENNYRKLKEMKDEEVIEAIKRGEA